MAGRRRRWLVGAVVVLVAVAFLPPVRTRTAALGVLAEIADIPIPRPFASTVVRAEGRIGGVDGDLYLPHDGGQGIVFVHGAARKGKDDPRMVRAARAIARGGRTVFVPALELAERRFVPEDLDRIVASSLALGRELGQPITLLGVSYGGSFALIAGTDPRLDGRVGQVAVFGAYFDLVGVVQGITTGVSLVGDKAIPFEPDPRADDILDAVSVDLVPASEGSLLRRALDRSDPAGLPPASRAVYDLLRNRDPARTEELASRLGPDALDVLRRFSPSSVARDLRVPVVAMHSRDDRVVPYGEALRLVEALPDAQLTTIGTFRHVDIEEGGRLRSLGDLWRAWGFAARVLGG